MISYRPAVPDDRAFILSGWSSSLRTTRDIPIISMNDYAAIMRPQIAKVLDRREAETIVACGASLLYGFICAAPPSHVFYIYVAGPYRKQGIARGLFAAAGIDPLSPFGYACRTKTSWELRGKVPSSRYDPYRARFAEKETP